MSCISSLALRSLARLLLVLLLVVLPGCAVKQAEQSESTLHLRPPPCCTIQSKISAM